MIQTAMERGARWKEASQANPCPVCGAKKWCRVSPDGRVVNCRHERAGAVKCGTYRDGGQYYVHKLVADEPKPNGRPRRHGRPAAGKPSGDCAVSGRPAQDSHKLTDAVVDVQAGDNPGELAREAAEQRDAAYRRLLAVLVLSPEHRQDLHRRGLLDAQIDAADYRTWPQDRSDQMLVAMRLFYELGNATFVRIPGFGPRCTEIHAAPGLLIPVLDLAGRIIALKVRRDDAGDGGPRYLWLSSRTKRNPDGPSPGSPAHVPFGIQGPVGLCRITEGELKADIAYRLSGIPTVSFPGVDSWRRVVPILQALEAKTVRIAFDADVGTNRNVARRLAECVNKLATLGYAVELERWPADAGKGIDDVLAAGRAAEIEILNGPEAAAAVEEVAAATEADEPLIAPTLGGDEKKSQATLLVELAEGANLWHTPGDGDAYASVHLDAGTDDNGAGDKATEDAPDDKPDDDHGNGGPVAHWPVRSKPFRRWLAREFYLSFGKAPGSQALHDALNVIEGQAAFAGQEWPVFVRVAGHDGRVYLDLANGNWEAVEIDADGWRVIKSSDCPVRFRRSKSMMPLPTPRPGGDINELRRYVNVAPDGWPLLVGWLAASLNPAGPYPILALHGEQGSAKTSTGLVVQKIIDPNSGGLRSEPREPRDLMIAASNCWVLAYDNLSHIEPWLSDAFCRLSTGGGFATRTLYSDDEETIFYAKRPILLTGIEELATRSDLIDRTVINLLPRITEERRVSESEFCRAFDAAAPQILGAVLDAVSVAIRNRPTTHLERLPRMADFALWATAAESGFGLRSGEFMAAYLENRQVANETALESSPVAKYVLDLAETGGWAGTPSDLHAKLETLATDQEKHAKSWPKTARPLSGLLRRLAPNLRAAGAQIEFRHDGRGKAKCRTIEIFRSGDAKQPGGDATGTQTAHRVEAEKHGLGTLGTQGTQNSILDLERSERCKVTI